MDNFLDTEVRAYAFDYYFTRIFRFSIGNKKSKKQFDFNFHWIPLTINRIIPFTLTDTSGIYSIKKNNIFKRNIEIYKNKKILGTIKSGAFISNEYEFFNEKKEKVYSFFGREGMYIKNHEEKEVAIINDPYTPINEIEGEDHFLLVKFKNKLNEDEIEKIMLCCLAIVFINIGLDRTY